MKHIESLINFTLEIEGLLRTLRDRDCIEAEDLLKAKITELYTTVCECPTEEPALEQKVEYDFEYPAVEESAGITEKQEHEEPEPSVGIDETAPATEHKTEVEKVQEENELRPVNLLKMLTINDKYRFCRELFHSRQDDFKSAMNILAEAESFDEACDYLYNDLMWSQDNETVAEFMEIVKKSFAV